MRPDDARQPASGRARAAWRAFAAALAVPSDHRSRRRDRRASPPRVTGRSQPRNGRAGRNLAGGSAAAPGSPPRNEPSSRPNRCRRSSCRLRRGRRRRNRPRPRVASFPGRGVPRRMHRPAAASHPVVPRDSACRLPQGQTMPTPGPDRRHMMRQGRSTPEASATASPRLRQPRRPSTDRCRLTHPGAGPGCPKPHRPGTMQDRRRVLDREGRCSPRRRYPRERRRAAAPSAASPSSRSAPPAGRGTGAGPGSGSGSGPGPVLLSYSTTYPASP